MGVARMNVLDAARLGLRGMEHWYGLPEALFADRTIQDYPPDYNYNDEQHRFGQAGRLWKQAAPPGSEKWNAVMDELLELRFMHRPDAHHLRGQPRPDARHARRVARPVHAAVAVEVLSAQPRGARLVLVRLDDARRDRVEEQLPALDGVPQRVQEPRRPRDCTGSDSGFIYKLYGFDYIRELELLQEAGFHPLEVIRAATLCGAETLAEPKGTGRSSSASIRPGLLADLVIVRENPLANLKVLYGTGAIRVNDDDREGGARRRHRP